MIAAFKNYVGVTLLLYLISRVGEKFSINELARKNKIAPRSAELFCKSFLEERLLEKEIVGKSHLYYVNTENEQIKQLKKVIYPFLLLSPEISKFFSEFKPQILSVYLYGSCANGSYNSKSDVDLFILSVNDLSAKEIMKITDYIGGKIPEREILPSLYSFEQYRKKIKNPFFLEVKKGVKIYGDDL